MTAPTGGPPVKAAGGLSVATKTAAEHHRNHHHNGYRHQDGYAAPDAEDRADAELLALAAERGYRLACRCVDCGHWLADPVSVRHHRGPTCRRRAGVDA